MSNTLTFKRAALVEALEAALEARETARKESQDKIDANNKEASDRIKNLIDDHPEFLVWLNNVLQGEFGESATHSDLEKEVEKAFGKGIISADGKPHDPDAGLKRLITVYKAASDTDIEIEENDDVLSFL